MRRSTYLCPYCFHEHKRKDLYYRCMNRRCRPRPDKELAAYNGRAPELKQICFPSDTKTWLFRKEAAACPECQEYTSTIVCPYCHNNLSRAMYDNRQILLSAVGAMDAGKSSYLAVLMRELRRRIGPGFGGVVNFMDEISAREYEERFLRYLYPCIGTDPSMRIPKTRSTLYQKTGVRNNRPILMNFKHTDLFDESVFDTMVFYDSAGEDYEDEEVMFRLAKQIPKADGILFFVDPVKFRNVTLALPRETVKGAATVMDWECSRPEDILDRMIRLIRIENNLKDSEQISIPIAVVCTKLDVYADLLPKGSPLLRESPHMQKKRYDRQDDYDVQQELRGLFYHWGEQGLLCQLESDFSNYHLFAVSAFGNNPDEFGRLNYPMPVRVEDPLLWLLKERGMIQ